MTVLTGCRSARGGSETENIGKKQIWKNNQCKEGRKEEYEGKGLGGCEKAPLLSGINPRKVWLFLGPALKEVGFCSTGKAVWICLGQ